MTLHCWNWVNVVNLSWEVAVSMQILNLKYLKVLMHAPSSLFKSSFTIGTLSSSSDFAQQKSLHACLSCSTLHVLSFDVPLEVMLPPKGARAGFARERSFPSVSPHVNFQIVSLVARIRAHVTLERLLPRVNSNVLFQISSEGSCIRTELTLLKTFALVHTSPPPPGLTMERCGAFNIRLRTRETRHHVLGMMAPS